MNESLHLINKKMKVCTKCKQTKAFTEFSKRSRSRDGLQTRCKVCRKTYYQTNREKANAKAKKWAQTNRERVNANNRKYYQNNREKKRASLRKRSKRPEAKKRRNARLKKRYHTDPQYRLACNLRSRVHDALKGKNKSASTMAMLGCSYTHVMEHLEKQFQPGMTWENQGEWHADHMMPCASFDLTDPEQQRRCFHYTNLQPMWASENISKQDKILYNRVWNGNQWINNN